MVKKREGRSETGRVVPVLPCRNTEMSTVSRETIGTEECGAPEGGRRKRGAFCCVEKEVFNIEEGKTQKDDPYFDRTGEVSPKYGVAAAYLCGKPCGNSEMCENSVRASDPFCAAAGGAKRAVCRFMGRFCRPKVWTARYVKTKKSGRGSGWNEAKKDHDIFGRDL